MKTVLSVTQTNQAEESDDKTFTIVYSEGTPELMKKSVIDAKAGITGQSAIDRAVDAMELAIVIKEMAEEAQ